MRRTVQPQPSAAAMHHLSTALQVSPLVAQLLLQRGVTTYEEAKTFFRPKPAHLHSPFLMQDMDKAVARIEQAMAKQESILVYGDYDVDGTTAVALLASFLRERYPAVTTYTYVPDRYAEGYGVSFQGIDFAAANGCSLIIALDCGIKAVKQVEYAHQREIDFIVCDHHRPGVVLPRAVAVLDPKREDCHYPYKELCGCGVGFKLIQALASRKGISVEALLPYLDLVATAIAADIVPLTGENRVLTYLGLQVINTQPRIGFQAMIGLVNKKTFSVSDVVFTLAPRINAAGRMSHGQCAVDLLMATDLAVARRLAQDIEQFNNDRKNLDMAITAEALLQIQQGEEEQRFTSVVYQAHWHKGVIGIVASRLTETYYRPTLVFTKSGDKLAASARSIKGFDVYTALEACSSYLEQFGGHKYAAGLTLLEPQYEPFKAQFEKVVSQTIDPALLEPELSVDAVIQLKQITPKLLRIIRQFAPFGPGNMRPVFMAQGLQGVGRGVGQEEKHLKLSVSQNGSTPLEAIGFNLGHKVERIKNGKPFTAVFSLDENVWNGITSLQLRVRDIF